MTKIPLYAVADKKMNILVWTIKPTRTAAIIAAECDRQLLWGDMKTLGYRPVRLTLSQFEIIP